MELKIHVNSEEVLSTLPIMPIVSMCYPGSNWKTFSCRRRINEFFNEDKDFGWSILEESIGEAILLDYFLKHNRILQIDLQKWERLKIIMPWAASVIHFGITGKQSDAINILDVNRIEKQTI